MLESTATELTSSAVVRGVLFFQRHLALPKTPVVRSWSYETSPNDKYRRVNIRGFQS
jgi:hypothetical protein